MPAAPTSQDGGSTSASSETAARLGRQLTRSELYTSLLLECGFGYPLWKPAPRCTPEGEYVVSIGDVGILTDGLPFNVLFNITQPIDSLANKDGVPEGVHPPCILQPRWITVVNRYHREGTMIAQPKGAISHHHLQQSSDSSAYTLRLTNSHGALLKLPKGGVLRNLERTTEFHERIQKHWRQWYEFAETQGDLGGNQTLYVVTGVEQCSTWAAAAWDDAPGERPELLSLRLEVGKPIGNCSWAYSTARCETQTADPSGDCDAGDLKNTVFVRGFWVNKFGGSVDSAFLPSTRFGGLDDGLGDDDGGGDGLHGRSSSGPSPLSGSPSGFGSAPASGGGCGDSGAVAQTDSVNLAPDLQVQNLSIDCLGPSESTICRPCEVINRFAFEVISRTNSAVLNTECIVVSHDNDWISTLEESDNGFPGHSEFLQRICSKFKFVIEKGMEDRSCLKVF
ncbi:hypothetical protein L218DRAFT_69126 [Marasmius fiardii PR-910]|nr:hypothetical protein L218DRAFT_69126 [Marasmius fiardii PR-910]